MGKLKKNWHQKDMRGIVEFAVLLRAPCFESLPSLARTYPLRSCYRTTPQFSFPATGCFLSYSRWETQSSLVFVGSQQLLGSLKWESSTGSWLLLVPHYWGWHRSSPDPLNTKLEPSACIHRYKHVRTSITLSWEDSQVRLVATVGLYLGQPLSSPVCWAQCCCRAVTSLASAAGPRQQANVPAVSPQGPFNPWQPNMCLLAHWWVALKSTFKWSCEKLKALAASAVPLAEHFQQFATFDSVCNTCCSPGTMKTSLKMHCKYRLWLPASPSS